MSTPLLHFDSICHDYGDGPVLVDVDLALQPGEILTILGASGSGKSTLLRLAAGLEKPTKGQVHLQGVTVAGPRFNLPPEKRGVGMVFQDHALFPHLNAAANVAFGISKLDPDTRRDKVQHWLSQVGLEGLNHRYPHELSGGQQQRLALARTLAPNPKLVLMDEPFASLDLLLRLDLREATTQILRQAGVSALIVSHDAEEAMLMADRLAVIQKGRLLQVGTPEEVYRRPKQADIVPLFGAVDQLEGVVKEGYVQCAIGRVKAPTLNDGARARILIRHGAIDFDPQGDLEVEVLSSVVAPGGRWSRVRSTLSEHTLNVRHSGPAPKNLCRARVDLEGVFTFAMDPDTDP